MDCDCDTRDDRAQEAQKWGYATCEHYSDSVGQSDGLYQVGPETSAERKLQQKLDVHSAPTPPSESALASPIPIPLTNMNADLVRVNGTGIGIVRVNHTQLRAKRVATWKSPCPGPGV